MASHHHEHEIKIHGQHACRAVFRRRPEDLLRAYVSAEASKPFGDLLSHLARLRRTYKVVTPGELEKLTDSRHHEGICVVARPRPARSLADVLRAPGPAVLVALVGVQNPHNIGAILRTAAHFGARAVVLPGAATRLSPAAERTAQGGAEWIDVVGVETLDEVLTSSRTAGFTVCASSSHQGRNAFAETWPPRAVLMLGGEGEGLPPEIRARADLLVRIPGTGHVESLNVAAAAAVLLGEFWRQSQPQTK